MDTRLGILSAAAFAGVVIGGLLIADPGVAGAVNPAALFGDRDDEHDDDDDAYEGEYEDGEHEYEDDDEHEDDEHEREHDDDEYEEDDDDDSTRSGDVRFTFNSHGGHEDDD